MIAFLILSALGSVASLVGLGLSIYILRREVLLQDDVTALKNEEEAWHDMNIGHEQVLPKR